VYRLKPMSLLQMSMWRFVFRKVVTRPSWPRVKMNARASGTPAKLEATPEKVMTAVRRNFGRPPRITAYASSSPKMPPAIAVTALISMLFAYAFATVGVDRSA